MSEALVEEMLEYWQHLESFFGVKLTLHDHTGSFLLPEKVKLLPGTNVHQSPCCAFWYKSRERCQLHCNFEAAKKAAEGSPFVSTCFCGVTELVLPLYIGQIHAATIFAGMFRQKDFDLSAFPVKYRKIYAQMPEWDETRLPLLQSLLKSAGYSVLMMAENLRMNYAGEQGRLGQIHKFFRTRYAENVGVSDLAAELELSESRTIHILLTEFKKGFSQLLTEERLSHVERLLTESNLPLRKIAEMSGFSNEYYLSTVFKKHYGMSPGEKRKASKNEAAEKTETKN